MDWPVGVGAFAAGYIVGWVVGVIRRRHGRYTVTIVSDDDRHGDPDASPGA